MDLNELRRLAGLPPKQIEKALVEGYMGITHWNDSDMAAELTTAVGKAVIATLKKELPKKANSWNTDGYINVALVMVDLSQCDLFGSHASDEYEHFAKQVVKILEDHADEWGKMEDKTQTRQYKALVTKMKKIAGKPLKEDKENHNQLALPMKDWSNLDELIDQIIKSGDFKVDFDDQDGHAVHEAMREIYRKAYKAGQEWAKEEY